MLRNPKSLSSAVIAYQSTIKKLGKKNKNAARFLKYCAYLHPKNMDPGFLGKFLNLPKEALDDCVDTLRTYNLLSTNACGLQMDSQTQEAIRYYEDKIVKINIAAERIKPLLQCFYQCYPIEKRSVADDAAQHALAPHIEAVIKHSLPAVRVETLDENSAAAYQANVYDAVADFYGTRIGNHDKQREYAEKSLAIYLKIYGTLHPDVAARYSKLSDAYLQLGDTNNSLRIQHIALAIFLRVHNHVHPEVAASYSRLGYIYTTLGRESTALECRDKVLIILSKIRYTEDPTIAHAYRDLGNTYNNLGRWADAITHHKKALAIYLKVYDYADPHVTRSYEKLSSLYKKLGYRSNLAIRTTGVPAVFFYPNSSTHTRKREPRAFNKAVSKPRVLGIT